MSDNTDMLLKLYVLSNTPQCRKAIEEIDGILGGILDNKYRIEIIDLEEYPEAAEEAQILAIPTLIKEEPKPSVRLVGDLSSTELIMTHLSR